MKYLYSLLLIFIFIGSNISRAQGAPPPCGYSPGYSCNEDGSDYAVFNLREIYPFTFCYYDAGAEYETVQYYETAVDMNNKTNPISNPEAYVNLTNPQLIYMRTDKLSPDGNFDVLTNEEPISVVYKSSASKPTPLVLCDTNNNGIQEFTLNKKNQELLAGLDPSIYSVSYFENLEDAQNRTNTISSTSYTNTSNPQIIYARIGHWHDTDCVAFVELELYVDNNCQDIAVYLASQSTPRPGFIYGNYLIVKNTGPNTVLSGKVQFDMDPSLILDSVTDVDAGNSVTNTSTGFDLNFFNLEPNEHETVLVAIKVPGSTALGTILTNTATYTSEDFLIENNTASISRTVVGSYDPNDILESHGPEIEHDSFSTEDYLYYTIRFQNIGTAEAIDVSIDNTLDSQLDPSTIQVLGSSHANTFLRSGPQLNWQFDNINLPSESMDEPNSHGYVHYKIKPYSGFSVGDIIPNTAEIYFDFNPAVVTNTFETEFVTTLSVEDDTISNFKMYPNPAMDKVEVFLTIKAIVT